LTEPDDDESGHELTQAGWSARLVLGQARAWAFFAVGDSGARLLASDKIDRFCLDDFVPLASTHAVPMLAVLAHDAPGDTSRTRLILAFPRGVGPRDHGLLYLEGPPTLPPLGLLLNLHADELDAVLRTSVGPAMPSLSQVQADATADETEALTALLERHEWNVARVARTLGVTRLTVYNRMRSHGIARVKVAKTPRRRRPGQEDP